MAEDLAYFQSRIFALLSNPGLPGSKSDLGTSHILGKRYRPARRQSSRFLYRDLRGRKQKH